MVWFLYNIIFAVGYALMLPKFLFRMARRGGYAPGFLQRFGVYDAEVRARLGDGERIWVHAVSVGEVFVALRFIEELRKSDPQRSFVLTVTTSTGHAIAGRNISENDILLYFPVDFPFVIRRVLRQLSPMALLLTECELWPNLVRIASGRDIPVILINGRISGSSYRGYKLLSFFTRRVLDEMDMFLVQTEDDGWKLMDLGAPRESVHELGSAKYDVVDFDRRGEEKARAVLENCGIRSEDLVLLGGSTWPGEEKAILEVFVKLRERYDRLKLVLVPRHAERRAEIEREIREAGLEYVKRSDMGPDTRTSVDVLLVDTTGELKDLYSCATVIFVGKSLTACGGQNFIEPAFFGKPIVTGTHLENFPVVASDFLRERAMIQVKDEDELFHEIARLLSEADYREGYGRRAKEWVESRKGVVSRSVKLMERYL